MSNHAQSGESPKDDWLTASEAYRQFIDFLNARGTDYCFVGPHDNFQDNVSGDVDIVLDPALEKRDYQTIISDFCTDTKSRPVLHVWHNTTAHSYILWLGGKPGIDQFIKLDFSGNFLSRGRYIMSAKEILADRRKAIYENGNERDFFIPAAKMEFIYYLLSKLEQHNLPDAKAKHLANLWKEAPEEAREQLECYWDKRDVTKIEDCANKDSWLGVQNNLSGLWKNTLRQTKNFSVKGRIEEAKRIWHRISLPTGIHIVFLGPDGSGKTTLINRAMADLLPIFPRTSRHYLFPNPTYDLNRPSSTEPHADKIRNLPESILKLALWLFRYRVGWLRHILLAKIKTEAIYFDRYYDDLLVDPKRYRYGGPIWLARLICNFVPQPDLFILLDAPAETLRSRKQEVPLEEIERQRKAYLDLINGMKNGWVIDASQPLDDVVIDTNSVILEYLAERTKKHSKI